MIDLIRLMYDNGASMPALQRVGRPEHPPIDGQIEYIGPFEMATRRWHAYVIKELRQDVEIYGWWVSYVSLRMFTENPQKRADQAWDTTHREIPGWGSRCLIGAANVQDDCYLLSFIPEEP